MKKGYKYMGKLRKEVWLTPTTIRKIMRAANKAKLPTKQHMENVLVDSVKNKTIKI